jgi:adenine phosphoribosyltransferase
VLIVDDVLATGGTTRAAGQLARTLGAEVVGWSFLLEIGGLGGAEKLHGGVTHIVARR